MNHAIPIPGVVFIALVTALPFPLCRADTLELKNGTILQGKYVGGTAGTVRLETAQDVQVFSRTDLLALTFSDSASSAPPAPPKPPADSTPPAAVSVPAGALLTVRMDMQVSSEDAAGKKFSAKLVADLSSGDIVVAKAGTTVFGQVQKTKQAGRLAGKSQLEMTLTGMDFSGKIVPMLTTNFAETGKGSFRKTARNAGVGALIGHAIDDDGGAGAGAAVGAGVSLIRKGDSVTVPAGAILEFRLTQPLNVMVGR